MRGCMTDQLLPCRKEFDVWFIANARAPIDPWHKEFAWSVWQAAQLTRPTQPPTVTDEKRRAALEALDRIYRALPVGHRPTYDIIHQALTATDNKQAQGVEMVREALRLVINKHDAAFVTFPPSVTECWFMDYADDCLAILDTMQEGPCHDD